MKKLLVLFTLTVTPLVNAAERSMSGVADRVTLLSELPSNAASDYIVIHTEDGEIRLHKSGKTILEQSQTLKDMFEDAQEGEAIPIQNVNSKQFLLAFRLMGILHSRALSSKRDEMINQILVDMSIKQLSPLWSLFNFLDVEKLTTVSGDILANKVIVKLKQNPEAIKSLLTELPEQFKKNPAPQSIKKQALIEIANSSKPIATFTHTNPINAIAFDPAQNLVAINDKEIVQIYDTTNPSNPTKLTSLKIRSLVTAVAFDPSNKLLALGSLGGVTIYDTSTPRNITLLHSFRDGGYSVAFDPVHKLLATASRNINIYSHLRQGAIRTSPHHFITPQDAPKPVRRHLMIRALAFDPNHNLLAAGDTYGDVTIYDTRNPHNTTPLTMLTMQSVVNSVSFDSTHELLAIGDQKGHVEIYSTIDSHNPIRLTSLKIDSKINSVAFDSANKLLAVGSNRGLHLYNTSDPTDLIPLPPLKDHKKQDLLSVAFDSRRGLLATGSWNRTAYIYDISTLSSLSPLSSILIKLSEIYTNKTPTPTYLQRVLKLLRPGTD